MPAFQEHGWNLHYLLRGRGEAVLLLHGLGSSGADWAFQVPALETQFRVIVPDLPGCGHSSPPPQCRYDIAGIAAGLWSLLDSLGESRANIVGFSLGGAVALEMALQRPASVPRLALINSLASYRIDHWRKWLEARVPVLVVATLGMRRVARLSAARLFPDRGQRLLRARATAVIGAVPAAVYLGLLRALGRWSATERLDGLQSHTLLISGEHDYTGIAEKQALAARLGAAHLVVRGSRHGTPFDAVAITNASLLALLRDQALPLAARRTLDVPVDLLPWPGVGGIAAEHAASECAATG